MSELAGDDGTLGEQSEEESKLLAKVAEKKRVILSLYEAELDIPKEPLPRRA